MTVEPLFDFETGEFVMDRNRNPVLVTGKEGLKNWLRKILHTPLGRYEIYQNTGYGTRLEELLVGKSFPAGYMTAEVERCVREAALQNPDILNIDSFSVRQEGARLYISFRADTVYGGIDTGEVLLYG